MTDAALQRSWKLPESVLVVIHTPALEVLLLSRADWPGYWQSVTGSKDAATESFEATAVREVHEETGIDARAPGHVLSDWRYENDYEIWPRWRHRYASGVVRNREHVFGLCVPAGTRVVTSPREHLAARWLPWREAAAACFSKSNAQACLDLPQRAQGIWPAAPVVRW